MPSLIFLLSYLVGIGPGQEVPAVVPAKAPPRIPIPAGSSPEFFQTAREVHGGLEQGNFEAATKRIRLLPSRAVTFGWDEDSIPFEYRNGYADARDAAFTRWTLSTPSPSFTEKASPLIQFRFSKSLGVDPTTGSPKAAAILFRNGIDPRMECVISLTRGANGAATTGIEVQNEVNYAVAMYFGLSPNPILGTAATRSDLPMSRLTGISGVDMDVYRKIQEYTDALKLAVKTKDKWHWRSASMFIDPKASAAPETEEGNRAKFAFQLTNNGSGPLVYRAAGDCGCVIPPPGGVIAPGGTTIIRPEIDTTGFKDLLDHRIILYTNDPENSVRSLPIRVKVVPRFNWTDPFKGVLVMDSGDADVRLGLEYDSARKLDWTLARVDGTEGILSPVTKTVGKRTVVDLSVKIEAPIVPGRTMVTISVPTVQKKDGIARYSFYVQNGIATLPNDVYLGTLGGEPKVTQFLVSRPGKPFRINRIASDLAWLKLAKVDAGVKDEYRISVSYTGGAPVGEILGTISIFTDDLKQPVIKMAVSGARV